MARPLAVRLDGNDPWICPSNGTCAQGTTCCERPESTENAPYYGCCKYSNAVCCPGAAVCCPNGFYCDMSHKRCVQQT